MSYIASKTGTAQGIKREATILKDNRDGTIQIGLDQAGTQETKKEFTVAIPLDWCGPQGQFAGGSPTIGATVTVVQGQGGKWYVDRYLPSNTTFKLSNQTFSSASQSNLTTNLKPDRYVIQVKDQVSFFLDPSSGLQGGNTKNYFQLDPKRGINSLVTSQQLEFSESHYKVSGIIKRDVQNNVNRNLIDSTFNGLQYDDTLFSVGLDPSTQTNSLTSGNMVRNLPLTEERKVYFEFAESYNFAGEEKEFEQYNKNSLGQESINNDRRKNRTISLNLHDQNLNFLIETISGTMVDCFGNILDLNKSILPLGRKKELSFQNSDDKAKSFASLRKELKKSVAYHFEINTRFGDNELTVPHNPLEQSQYGREKSHFTFDVNKEGQFKLNIPASSNFGGIPLLTRTEHYNLILNKEKPEFSTQEFIRNTELQDLYLSGISKNKISLLNGKNNLETAPVDYLTNETIKYGTAYHDITSTCSISLNSAPYIQAERKLVDFSKNNILNKTFKPLPEIVSNKIYVDGDNANAGGRSGLINLDGFIQLNVGANKSDNQSVWFDYEGGVVGNIGKDKQNISYAVGMDGDCYIEIGQNGVDKKPYRNGTFDLKVLLNGQTMIFRMDQYGITIVSPGRIVFDCQQDMELRSNGAIKMHAEVINLYSESNNSRNVERFGGSI